MELIEQDFKRDFFLNAEEAMQYGIIDQLLTKQSSTASADAAVAQSRL